MKLFKQWNPHIKLNIVVLPIFSCSWPAGPLAWPAWMLNSLAGFQFLVCTPLPSLASCVRMSGLGDILIIIPVIPVSSLRVCQPSADRSRDRQQQQQFAVLACCYPEPISVWVQSGDDVVMLRWCCVPGVTCSPSNDERSGQPCGHARPQPALQPTAIFTLCQYYLWSYYECCKLPSDHQSCYKYNPNVFIVIQMNH